MAAEGQTRSGRSAGAGPGRGDGRGGRVLRGRGRVPLANLDQGPGWGWGRGRRLWGSPKAAGKAEGGSWAGPSPSSYTNLQRSPLPSLLLLLPSPTFLLPFCPHCSWDAPERSSPPGLCTGSAPTRCTVPKTPAWLPNPRVSSLCSNVHLLRRPPQ